jgi:hypothetical protein
MKKRSALFPVAIAVAVLGSAVSSQAQTAPQKSSSSGFFLGGGIEGNGIVSTQTDLPSTTESGPGAGLVVGYGFNPTFSLYGQLGVTGFLRAIIPGEQRKTPQDNTFR